MGKDLKGKELGTGLRQKSNGVYSARYVDRFGNRKEIYDRNLAELKRKLNTALYDDAKGNSVEDNSITLSQWFKSWIDIHKYKVIRNNTKNVLYAIVYQTYRAVFRQKENQRHYTIEYQGIIKRTGSKGLSL